MTTNRCNLIDLQLRLFRVIMQMLQRINTMLEKGWKMTNVSCTSCNGTTMAEPKEQIEVLYCPKENKEFPYDLEQSPSVEELKMSDEEQQHNVQQFYQTIINESQANKQKVQQPTFVKVEEPEREKDDFFLNQKDSFALNKTNDVSKKIGQKLLQGWTMLNESCNDCYAPIMKSRKGEKICFGCDKDLTKKQEVVEPKAQVPKKEKIQEPVRQEKISPAMDSKPLVPEEKPVKKSPKHASKPQNVESLPAKSDFSSIFDRIQQRSLLFLQGELEKSMKNAELDRMEKILSLVFNIKNEFR